MNRTELAALANPKARDTQSVDVSVTVETSPLRSALASYFASPEGQRDLADAPRPNGRQMTAAEAVDALIEESR